VFRFCRKFVSKKENENTFFLERTSSITTNLEQLHVQVDGHPLEVDVLLQLGSPKTAAPLVQRVGHLHRTSEHLVDVEDSESWEEETDSKDNKNANEKNIISLICILANEPVRHGACA
jgi:hypothetical protein